MTEIEAAYEADMAKFQEVRELLAKKNLAVSQVSRKIDEMPSKDELLQYERRFIELHDLVAAKLQENKKVVEQYNVLEQTHSFLQKQTSLLNSIQEAIPKAIKSKEGKEALLKSVRGILEGVSKSQEKVVKDVNVEKQAFDTLNARYTQILDIERQYFKAVKDFQDECVKNEQMTAMLQERGGK
jgi:chromosome segregation ATPase